MVISCNLSILWIKLLIEIPYYLFNTSKICSNIFSFISNINHFSFLSFILISLEAYQFNCYFQKNIFAFTDFFLLFLFQWFLIFILQYYYFSSSFGFNLLLLYFYFIRWKHRQLIIFSFLLQVFFTNLLILVFPFLYL